MTSARSTDREEGSYAWDVFLSHNSSDKARVERLAKALEERNLRVWFDKTAIRGSSSIPLKVEEGLEGSRTVVLCLSPAFLASEWTAYERAAILHQDPANKRQSFLLLDFKPCALPRGLAHFRRLDFRRYSERKVDEIIDALQIDTARTKPKPGPVTALLAEAKASERRGDYAEALELSRRALTMALDVDPRTAEANRDIARASIACCKGLLYLEMGTSEAWELAQAACDPAVLDGYPELLFSALISKAEAGMATGRIQAAQAAANAAQDLAADEDDQRCVLQVQGHIALIARAPDEAAKLYDQAAQSFAAELNRRADPNEVVYVQRGIGSCMHNKGRALHISGDIIGASIAFHRAADWFARAGSYVDESVSRRFLADCHFDEQNWQAGLDELARAQMLSERANFPSGTVACLELRARVLATTNRPGEARAALIEALEMSTDVLSNDTGAEADRRRFHQMLATLEEEAGNLETAREHLESARLLAEASGDSLHIADVAQQLRHLGKDGRVNESATEDVFEVLNRRLHETESPGRVARTMQQLAGAHRSRGDLAKARDWHKRAYDAAMGISDHALAASALVGLAEIAIVRNEDSAAQGHLIKARALVEYLPAWEVRTSIGYFMGRLDVRAGNPRVGLATLRDALAVATEHHIDDLAEEIGRLLEDVEDWMDFRKAPKCSLEELSQELASLEDWYPEARRQLRRLWYYWRGDELMKNILSYSGSKAIIVSSDADEVNRLTAELGCLFELTTFVAEDPFSGSDAPRQIQLLPFPGNLAMPYLNVLSVHYKEQG